MKSFQTVQKKLNAKGIYPKRQRFNHTLLINLVFGILGTTSLWIFLLHEADSPQELMESIYIVVSVTGAFPSFASTFLNEKNLFSIINSIDEFIDERLKIRTSKAIYEKTNELVEKCSKIGIFALKYVVIPSFILPKAIVSFFNYFTTDLGDDAFELPIPVWLPFDWKNPTGYVIAVAAMLLWGANLLEYMGCLVFLGFGIFMYTNFFVQEMKRELRSLNKTARHKKSQKGKMYKKLTVFIRTHADLKQISLSSSDFYEITLTILFVCSIISPSVSLLLAQIKMSHNEIDSIILLEAAVFGVWSLFLVSFICEIGQRFSNAIEEIGDDIGQLNWYLFPDEIQRVLSLVMQNAQKPVVIKFFGNVLLARDQFKKVVKFVYSNFMVLRKFYN